MIDQLVVAVIVFVVLVICAAFIWTGATAFTARGVRWSRDRYLHGLPAKVVGVPLLAIGIGGVGNLIHRGIESGIFKLAPDTPQRVYRTIGSPTTNPTTSRPTKTPRPASIPKGAHVDETLGFYIVPPDNYFPEPGMLAPLVARFKEKLVGEEIEHRVCVAHEPKPADMTLESHFNTQLQDLKSEPGTVILESGDATIGDRPCKYVIYRPRFVLLHMIYSYMDDDSLWMVVTASDRDRFDDDARKLLTQSIDSFRTFDMANEEAKRP